MNISLHSSVPLSQQDLAKLSRKAYTFRLSPDFRGFVLAVQKCAVAGSFFFHFPGPGGIFGSGGIFFGVAFTRNCFAIIFGSFVR